jgi:hypothetical protein
MNEMLDTRNKTHLFECKLFLIMVNIVTKDSQAYSKQKSDLSSGAETLKVESKI